MRRDTSKETHWLSMHAGYQCRHTGRCCTAGWPIPLEKRGEGAIRLAIGEGRLAAPPSWLAEAPPRPADGKDARADIAGLVAVDVRGHCVFHDADRCRLHRTLGHGALPSACQHFPRVCLLDARGVSVTLSHFCPTAAALLFTDGPVSIVPGPPALPGDAEPEGLDARGAWPPLLTARVLMDHGSYALWEAHVIDVLAGGEAAGRETAEAAVARLGEDARRLSGWTPAAGPLAEAVRLLRRSERESHTPPLPRGAMRALFDAARGAVPAPLDWPAVPDDVEGEWTARVRRDWTAWTPVVRRYLAAHAFASWSAYQGRGLSSHVGALAMALAVLQVELVRVCVARGCCLDRAALVEAVRKADLLLRHYADPQALADAV